MSLKIYIDTNIFLDSILKRDNGVAEEIFIFLEEKNVDIILNDICIVNIHYFAKKSLESLTLLKDKINTLLDEYKIVSANEKLLRKALNSDFIDFEDAIQYYCAQKANAQLIITNDKKGFKNSKIETINSYDFYNKYVKKD